MGLTAPGAHAGENSTLDALPPEILDIIGDRADVSLNDRVALAGTCKDLHAQFYPTQVHTQTELDTVLADPDAPTDIVVLAQEDLTIATPPAKARTRIFVYDTQPYPLRVAVEADVHVTALGTARVSAHNTAQVTVSDHATAWAFDTAQVTASGAARVYAWGSSEVDAAGNARVNAYETAQVTVSDHAQVVTGPAGMQQGPSCKKIIGRGSSVRIWVDDTTRNLVEAEDPATITILTSSNELYLKGKWS